MILLLVSNVKFVFQVFANKHVFSNSHSDFVPKVPRVLPDESSNFVNGFTSRRFYNGEISGIEYFNGLASHKGKVRDACE